MSSIAAMTVSHPCVQSFSAAGIAFNLILIRVAQNRVNPEAELPTFIGDSIEYAIPAAPRHNSEKLASMRGGLYKLAHVYVSNLFSFVLSELDEYKVLQISTKHGY